MDLFCRDSLITLQLGSISPGTISTMKEDFQNFLDEEANKAEVMKAEGDALAFLNKQSVSGKTVADAVEALIGIYVKVSSIRCFLEG